MTSDDQRAKALRLLSRGVITLSEAAELAGTSRQAVHGWCRRRGIDWQAQRRAWLLREWNRPTKAGKRPSKAQMRQRADMAEIEWKQRHG